MNAHSSLAAVFACSNVCMNSRFVLSGLGGFTLSLFTPEVCFFMTNDYQ